MPNSVKLTDVENALEWSRTTVTDRMRSLSDVRAARTEQLASVTRAYREGCAPLREARRTLRLMAAEWQRTCKAMDDVSDVMGMNRCRTLDRVPATGPDGEQDDGHGRRAMPEPSDLAEYFIPVDRRLNDIMFRLRYAQDNRVGEGGGDSGSVRSQPHHQVQTVEVGDSMSTGSEQEDDFVAIDLDSTKNRYAKMMTAVDPTTVPVKDQMLDLGQVPSLCPECLERRFEDDKNHGVAISDHASAPEDVCNSGNVKLNDAERDNFMAYFHRTVDCPVYNAEKSQKKRNANNSVVYA